MSIHLPASPKKGSHLIVAIRRGSPEQVALLVKSGEKVNTQFDKWAPLEHLTLRLLNIPAQSAHHKMICMQLDVLLKRVANDRYLQRVGKIVTKFAPYTVKASISTSLTNMAKLFLSMQNQGRMQS